MSTLPPTNPTTNPTTPYIVGSVGSPPSLGELLTEGFAALPSAIVRGIAKVVSSAHKEAAFVMGVLAAFGFVPTVNKTTDQLGSVLLLAYAAITHAAEQFGKGKA